MVLNMYKNCMFFCFQYKICIQKGILLNGEGTAVVNIGRRTTNTYDITIRNVNINGLSVMPNEGILYLE